MLGEDQVGGRHSPVGDTATDGESPAAVGGALQGPVPGKHSATGNCPSPIELRMTKSAQSRDKGFLALCQQHAMSQHLEK